MLKLQYSGQLIRRADSLEKTLMLGKIEDRRRRGQLEDEMVGWHHWLDGHVFEQTPGDGDVQGSLVYCSPWGCKELDRTEWLNNNLNFWSLSFFSFKETAEEVLGEIYHFLNIDD